MDSIQLHDSTSLSQGRETQKSNGKEVGWALEQVWVRCCAKCLSRPGMRTVISELSFYNQVILPGYSGCLLVGNCVIYEEERFQKLTT